MSLRRASFDDHDRLVTLQRAAYAANRIVLGVEPLPLQADYRRILDDMEVWVSDGNGDLQAALILDVRPEDLLIWSISTAPDRQSRGVGRRLLAFAEERARLHGRTVMRLYTGTALVHRVNWYARNGYQTERIDRMPDRSVTHMIKRLDLSDRVPVSSAGDEPPPPGDVAQARRAIDVERVRADTPAVTNLIHFNNAGAALSPLPVTQAVAAHLAREQAIGGYEAADEAEARLAALYPSLACLVGCRPDEIAFVENATRAWDMAFYAIPFRRGDRILTAEAEYASNYIAFLQMQRRAGVEIEVIPSNAFGEIDLEALDRSVRRGGVRLIAITHVPTQGGLINPAAEVGRIARAHGVFFLLDACQSVGQMPIDVEAIGCDMLSATGRKFLRAPRGTGFLYVRKTVLDQLEPPFLDLHAATLTANGGYEMLPDARRFENWESYVAGRLGLAAAADYALALGLEPIRKRVFSLADDLRRRLSALPGIEVRDLGRERCGIVTFTSTREEADAIRRRLAAARINVSVSRARYATLDLGRRGLSAVVRASVHYYNSEAEVARFCDVLAEAR